MKKIKLLFTLPALVLVGCGKNGGDEPQKPVDKWQSIDATEMKAIIDEYYGNLNVSFFADEEGFVSWDLTDDGEKITKSISREKAGFYASTYSGYRGAEDNEDVEYEKNFNSFGYDHNELIQYSHRIDEYKDVGVDTFDSEYWYVIEDGKEYYYSLIDGVCEKELYNDGENAVEELIEYGVSGLAECVYSCSPIAFETIAAVSLGISSVAKNEKHYGECHSIGYIGEIGELVGGINYEYKFFKTDDGSYKIVETLSKTSVTVNDVDLGINGTVNAEYLHEVVFGKHFIELENLYSVVSLDVDYGAYETKETYTDTFNVEFADDYELKPVPTDFVLVDSSK